MVFEAAARLVENLVFEMVAEMAELKVEQTVYWLVDPKEFS